MKNRVRSRYNMYEAKTKLSEIVEKVREGEEVILMNRGEPVAKVVPIETPKKQRRLGFLKDKIQLLPGWDQPIDDFEDYEK
jgi:prevent-host-death family protein